MTDSELLKAKKQLKCDYLRYYGEPEGRLSFRQQMYISWKKEREEKKLVNKLLIDSEIPDLNEEELESFLYLRACMWLGVKPIGDFIGNALICAEVMQAGGDIVAMYRAGANFIYCACLSHHNLNDEIQREIIDAHIPF